MHTDPSRSPLVAHLGHLRIAKQLLLTRAERTFLRGTFMVEDDPNRKLRLTDHASSKTIRWSHGCEFLRADCSGAKQLFQRVSTPSNFFMMLRARTSISPGSNSSPVSSTSAARFQS